MDDELSEYEFTSRYDVLGPPNGCKGECEGTGLIPIHATEADPLLRLLWLMQEARQPNDPEDSWHFVVCPTCQPTHDSVRKAREYLSAILPQADPEPRA
jgi:hypothetical protein